MQCGQLAASGSSVAHHPRWRFFCRVSFPPSPLLNLLKTIVDNTVNPPSNKNASCRPRIISPEFELELARMKNAVVNPAAATPKLTDICCIVLAMELALLVLSSG